MWVPSRDEIFSEEKNDVLRKKFQKFGYDEKKIKGINVKNGFGACPFHIKKKREMTNTVMDWANTHEVELINCMKVTDVVGLNFEEDSLDAGTHLNESGGKKVSRYIAEYLKENVLK